MLYIKNLNAIFYVLLFFTTTAKAQYDVKVIFEGISSVKGDLYIGLYNKPEGFMKKDKTYRQAILPVKDNVVIWEIKDLPEGDYSVVTFHDSNENGKCDFSFLGFPLEKFGFSLEPKLKFRAPYFEETSFRVDKNQKVTVYVKSLPDHLFQHGTD